MFETQCRSSIETADFVIQNAFVDKFQNTSGDTLVNKHTVIPASLTSSYLYYLVMLLLFFPFLARAC